MAVKGLNPNTSKESTENEPRNTNDANGATVDLSHLVWMKPPQIKEKGQEFFKRYGYAEAQKLPYEHQEGCLTVRFPSKEAKALGWHEAVDADGLPF